MQQKNKVIYNVLAVLNVGLAALYVYQALTLPNATDLARLSDIAFAAMFLMLAYMFWDYPKHYTLRAKVVTGVAILGALITLVLRSTA